MPGVKLIALSENKFAIIDEDDYLLVKDFKWYLDKTSAGYRARGRQKKAPRCSPVLMHRLIMDATKGMTIDHRNGNGLDNRRENLRLCTVGQNNMNRRRLQNSNTSGHRGVHWDKSRGRWIADISVNNKVVHLGRFEKLEDATLAYKCASIQHYGEFSPMDSSNYARDLEQFESIKSRMPGMSAGWFKKGERSGMAFEFQPKTHCIRGHEFTTENTRIRYKDGARCKACRTCQRAASRKRLERVAV